MGDNSGAEFLQQKYKLNTDPGVVATAKRHEQRTGESINQGDFSTRIQNYLDRLHRVINPSKLEGHDDFDRQERNLGLLKHGLYRNFVTKPENIPESYYDSIKRKHREEGHGDIEIPTDYRQELAQTLVDDQKRSLDLWVDYLASDDAKYPDWQKYFAFRSVLGMGNYDKTRGVFNERTRGGRTVAPFPELNREALSIVLGDLEKKYPSEKAQPDMRRADFEFTSRYDIADEVKQKYLRALDNKNFSQLYALAIEEFKPIAEGLLKTTEGAWVTYPSGSDPKKVVSSIAPYGTGWCLRGETTADRYLNQDKFDLHIYYSKDPEGNSVVPRVVMVVAQDGGIKEVRGVASQEELDPYIADVVDAKLSETEFEKEGRLYKKRSTDMKTLTAIYSKTKVGQSLSGEELTFLYEINAPIEGFGYNPKDPRVAELRSQRNPDEDMPTVFGCEIEQIARNPSDIRPDTKAYVGLLQTGVFELLSKYGIDHVYTKFPERKIRIEDLKIERKTKAELKQKLDGNGIKWRASDGSYAESMIDNPKFPSEIKEQHLRLVTLKVSDLGFDKGKPTTDQIYGKAKELGLERCPPEVGPEYRISYKNQPVDEWRYIGMDQITDSDGNPHVFRLARLGDGLWLHSHWAGPDGEWNLGSQFVFSLP